MGVIIEFKQIGKQYNQKSIITNFNLAIAQGELVTVIGSSGSGKTTLLKMLNGLVKPDHGTISIYQQLLSEQDIITLRRKIGYCIQGSVLFPHMTVAQNISYVLRLEHWKKKEIYRRIDECLEIVQLSEEMKQHYPDQLSGGQQQRVGIARALAADPDIILMDEPFGAVDEITRVELQKALKSIHEKTEKTIIFITHDIREALMLGTKVLVLDKGELQAYETPEQLQNNSNVFVQRLLNSRSD